MLCPIVVDNDEIVFHFFGDDDYAAVTGWPDMIQTVTNDGWMGIAPAEKNNDVLPRFLAN